MKLYSKIVTDGRYMLAFFILTVLLRIDFLDKIIYPQYIPDGYKDILKPFPTRNLSVVPHADEYYLRQLLEYNYLEWRFNNKNNFLFGVFSSFWIFYMLFASFVVYQYCVNNIHKSKKQLFFCFSLIILFWNILGWGVV
jgi:hypothetical protein